jgi:hypothetical protein
VNVSFNKWELILILNKEEGMLVPQQQSHAQLRRERHQNIKMHPDE